MKNLYREQVTALQARVAELEGENSMLRGSEGKAYEQLERVREEATDQIHGAIDWAYNAPEAMPAEEVIDKMLECLNLRRIASGGEDDE